MSSEEVRFPIVYEAGRRHKIAVYIAIGVVGTLIVLTLASCLLDSAVRAFGLLERLVLALFVGGVLVLLWRGAHRRTAVWEDRIEVTLSGKRRTVWRGEMRGYRRERHDYVFIVLKNPKASWISLPPEFWAVRHRVPWFFELDNEAVRTRRDIEQSIAADSRYGSTHFERQAMIGTARRLSDAINIAAILVALWNLIWPEPYEVATGAMIAIVVCAACAYLWSGGLIRLNMEMEEDPRPTLGFAACGLTILTFMRVTHLPTLDPLPDWIWWSIPTASIATLLFLWRDRWLRRSWVEPLSIASFGAVFLSTTMAHSNVMLDGGPSMPDSATLIRKVDGKGWDQHRIEVIRDQQDQRKMKLNVPDEIFSSLKVGDRVCLLRHRGWLNWPWVELRLCQ